MVSSLPPKKFTLPDCGSCTPGRHALCGMLPAELRPAVRAASHRLRVRAGETAIAQGDEANGIAQIIRGTVKVTGVREDGSRYIIAFAADGDTVGIETHSRHEHAVEAVSETELCIADRQRLDRLCDENLLIARAFRRVMMGAVRDTEQRLQYVARKSAREKVAAFSLAWLDRRDSEPMQEVPARLTQSDIADHLGMTPETMSRTLRALRVDGVIRRSADGQRFTLDRSLLVAIVQGEEPRTRPRRQANMWFGLCLLPNYAEACMTLLPAIA